MSPAGVTWLGDVTRADGPVLGAKAANLGELLRTGLPVPDGFVVAEDADDEQLLRAARRLGDVPLAVRSSAAAEDLADASFAGQYDTILGVRGAEALVDAVRRCRESARGARAVRYQTERVGRDGTTMAVLVQRMLDPEAAGVAFTANPVTGARDETVVIAARGLGERVVAGEAIGDEWLVGAAGAVCRRATERAIDAARASAIARLARRVEACFGAPQDVEWAIEAGELYLLQARPMTAVPEPVEWRPPSRGYWMRNFRVGEWLSEPMTPLFEDWLLTRIEAGCMVGMRRSNGAAVPFRHAAINGWYYTATPRFPLLVFPPALLRGGRRMIEVLWYALLRVSSNPEAADRRVLRRELDAWRLDVLPRYRAAVARGEARVDAATSSELLELVDEVAGVAGEHLWSLELVGGSAWKMESCLARFLRQHVPDAVPGGVQVLTRGLPGTELSLPPHAVQSLDWRRPTAGELGLDATGEPDPGRRARLVAEREAAESDCRQALEDRPGLRARFDSLLAVVHRYAAAREEQARLLTLGWPLLRRCALRLGAALHARGAVDDAGDVFFLTRAEVGGEGPFQERVSERRAEWERRSRLVAPLTIGRLPRVLERVLGAAVEAIRTPGAVPDGALVGEPASPGRATGPVRVVRGPGDFERFRAGEVLVARATAPAWTPLFALAAAVVTDGGTVAAHASLVAREYGIPAVVGTGEATARLRDGQVVTVDGSAGVVEGLGEPLGAGG